MVCRVWGGAAGNEHWGLLLPERLGRRCRHTACDKPRPDRTPWQRQSPEQTSISAYSSHAINGFNKGLIVVNEFRSCFVLTLVGPCTRTPWGRSVWSGLANCGTRCLWWRLRWRPVRETKRNSLTSATEGWVLRRLLCQFTNSFLTFLIEICQVNSSWFI